MTFPSNTTPIFVFGSNLAGIHGAGAANYAKLRYGAQRYVGNGPTGLAYALPTKDERIHTMSLSRIEGYVEQFLDYARKSVGMQFFVTRVGCGLAGYLDADIGPMFANAPPNCILPIEWRSFVNPDHSLFHGWERNGKMEPVTP